MNDQTGCRPGAAGVNKDLRLARRLYPHLGREIADISDYTYFSIMFEIAEPPFSELADKIALGGLDHYRLLGGLILALGANPALNVRLRNTPLDLAGAENLRARGREEMGRLIPPLFDAKTEAAREYAALAGGVDDNPAARRILERLSENEANHANLLRQVLSAAGA